MSEGKVGSGEKWGEPLLGCIPPPQSLLIRPSPEVGTCASKQEVTELARASEPPSLPPSPPFPSRVHVSWVVGAGSLEYHECALELGQVESGVLVEGGEAVSDDLGHGGVQRLKLLILSRNWNGTVHATVHGTFSA